MENPSPHRQEFANLDFVLQVVSLCAEFAGIFQTGASVLVWPLDRALNSLEILIQPPPATPRLLSFNICAPARATFARDKYSNEEIEMDKIKPTSGKSCTIHFPPYLQIMICLICPARARRGWVNNEELP